MAKVGIFRSAKMQKCAKRTLDWAGVEEGKGKSGDLVSQNQNRLVISQLPSSFCSNLRVQATAPLLASFHSLRYHPSPTCTRTHADMKRSRTTRRHTHMNIRDTLGGGGGRRKRP